MEINRTSQVLIPSLQMICNNAWTCQSNQIFSKPNLLPARAISTGHSFCEEKVHRTKELSSAFILVK